MQATTKLITRKRAEIGKRGKVARTGATFYEAWYWTGQRWDYKEFTVRKEATEFLKEMER